jgi:hypothetical protein
MTYAPYLCPKRRQNLRTRLDGVTFFEDGTTIDLDIKEVKFLISVLQLSILIDPHERILQYLLHF